MSQRRHHYERAFESYLRDRRVPYVSVDEARRALLPEGASLRVSTGAGGAGGNGVAGGPEDGSAGRFVGPGTPLKSFDFVIYDTGDAGGASGAGAGGTAPGEPARNLLIDVKGRKVTVGAGRKGPGLLSGRLESWVTQEDIRSLRMWEALFGPGFRAALVFVYWCEAQPPDGLFQEVTEYQGRWYALRAIELETYASAMKTRSARWQTVDLPAEAFERLSEPFAPGWPVVRAPA